MGTIFTVSETLNVNNTPALSDLKALAEEQLLIMGVLMLNDDAKFSSLTLSADGKEYAFSGEAPCTEFYALLTALHNAEDFSLSSTYNFRSPGFGYLALQAGPFNFKNEFSDYSEEELKGIFYSAWYTTDENTDDSGCMAAYGEKDGNFYFGEVEYSPVDPADAAGTWWNPITDLCFEPEALEVEKVPEALRYRDIYISMSDTDPRDDSDPEFISNCITLRSAYDIKAYIEVVSGLMSLSSDCAGSCGYFLDDSGSFPRMLHIDVHADGSADVLLAQI